MAKPFLILKHRSDRVVIESNGEPMVRYEYLASLIEALEIEHSSCKTKHYAS